MGGHNNSLMIHRYEKQFDKMSNTTPLGIYGMLGGVVGLNGKFSSRVVGVENKCNFVEERL